VPERPRHLFKGNVMNKDMARPGGKHLDIKDMSFEKALKESINIYERGAALKDHCDRLLKLAEAKVEKLTFNQAGEPNGTEPLKPQE
jgi:exodeoxyribonuclease VII small subunit